VGLIANHMAHAIAMGLWHGRIPAEAQLTMYYDCSRTTLGRAVDELCRRRLLDRRAPGGTFIPPDAHARARALLPLDGGPPPAAGA
jgi:DNA-binding GntR family transcriptional regulator